MLAKILFMLILFLASASCANNVLYIHGTWHGEWCFDKVKPLLSHNNAFIDYPSKIAETGIAFPSLSTYVQWNVEAINEAFGNNSKVSLVAHSAGGLIAAMTADVLGDRVEKLVLLSAFIAPNGMSLLQVGSGDPNSILYPYIQLNIDPNTGYPDGSYYVNPDNASAIFYNQCSSLDAEWAVNRLNNREVFPVMEPVVYTTNTLVRVKKYYILDTKDQAISYQYQKHMVDSSPFGSFTKFTLTGDHSPFLSRKSPLALLLNFIMMSN